MALEKTHMIVVGTAEKLKRLFLNDPEVARALVKLANASPEGKFNLIPYAHGKEIPLIEWVEYKDGKLSAKFWGDKEPLVISTES